MTQFESEEIYLRVEEVNPTSADIRVYHNSESDLFWFYTYTSDMEVNALQLLEEELAKTLEFYGEIPAYKGRNKSIPIRNLEAKTQYRVIAAFISISGEVISEVADLLFWTERDPEVFYLKDDWKIERLPQRTIDKKNVEKENFQCTVGDTLDTYIPFVIRKKDFEAYASLKACFDDFVKKSNENNIRWRTSIRNKNYLYQEERLMSDDYVYFMLGVDEEGRLTGYYSKTDEKIAQENQSDDYKYWLGDWKMSGFDYQGNALEYEVTIAAYENNLYYKMYGYEYQSKDNQYAEIPNQFPIVLSFEKATGDVYVISQFLGMETTSDVYFYLFGNINLDGVINYVSQENLKLARFTAKDKDKPEILSCSYDLYDSYGVQLTGFWTSFGIAYSGWIAYGFAPFSADCKVINLDEMTLSRL